MSIMQHAQTTIYFNLNAMHLFLDFLYPPNRQVLLSQLLILWRRCCFSFVVFPPVNSIAIFSVFRSSFFKLYIMLFYRASKRTCLLS